MKSKDRLNRFKVWFQRILIWLNQFIISLQKKLCLLCFWMKRRSPNQVFQISSLRLESGLSHFGNSSSPFPAFLHHKSSRKYLKKTINFFFTRINLRFLCLNYKNKNVIPQIKVYCVDFIVFYLSDLRGSHRLPFTPRTHLPLTLSTLASPISLVNPWLRWISESEGEFVTLSLK